MQRSTPTMKQSRYDARDDEDDDESDDESDEEFGAPRRSSKKKKKNKRKRKPSRASPSKQSDSFVNYFVVVVCSDIYLFCFFLKKK